jgi:hypothetical protein
LSVSNQRLSTYEKEFLVVLMAVDKWNNYFNRHPFIIQNDHKCLYHLQDQNMSNEMQRKAMIKFVGLQFKFQYKKGSDNKVVDALSRVAQAFSIQGTSAMVKVWIQEVINSYVVDDTAQSLLQELAVVSPNGLGFRSLLLSAPILQNICRLDFVLLISSCRTQW